MATHSQEYTTAYGTQSPTLLNRVQMSSVSTAIAISSESVSTAGHYQRKLYAQQVLNAPDAYAQKFLTAVVGQGVDANSTDATIDNAISSVWNALAGA